MDGITSSSSDMRAIGATPAAPISASHRAFGNIDAREYSEGYAIGAAICAALLLLEIIIVKGFLS
jgi:hypothetical protein